MMTPRVLVVEDHPVNLEVAIAMLEQEGCQVLTAETAEAGLRLAAAEHLDLILMDVQLPDMTGYEAVRRLKADRATANIPIVALTARAMQGEEARARQVGCDGYLTKPLEMQAFREMLGRHLPGRDRGTEG